ncbi:hypothetical protein HYV31_01235 [candidate division WWE3 bacterium]|nr:hypothetical protein [candidate division WWE3 bacterium]
MDTQKYMLIGALIGMLIAAVLVFVLGWIFRKLREKKVTLDGSCSVDNLIEVLRRAKFVKLTFNKMPSIWIRCKAQFLEIILETGTPFQKNLQYHYAKVPLSFVMEKILFWSSKGSRGQRAIREMVLNLERFSEQGNKVVILELPESSPLFQEIVVRPWGIPENLKEFRRGE